MYTAEIRKKTWQRISMLVLSFILTIGTLPMSLAQAEEVKETPVGPGGVGAPALWLRSDLGTEVTSGQKVSTWEDQGSKVNNATQDEVNNQPTYWDNKDHNINFNPVLEYDGTSSFMNLDVSKLPQGKSPRSIITVSKTNRTGDISYIISWGVKTSGYTGIGMLQNATRGGLTTFNSDRNQTLYTPEGFLGTTFPNEQFVTWTGGETESNIARLYSKMKQVQQLNDWGKDNVKLWDTGNSGGAVVGKLIPAATGIEHWQGTIEEIIVYDHALTDAERQKVSTYLAIKYGYTLDQTTANSYVDSNMTTIWDSQVNGAYTHRITSIGRDDQSGLMQKQAKAQELESVLTIALGNSIEDTNSANANEFSYDSSFFTFGDNGASAEFAKPSTKDQEKLLLMDRIYKVQKTNWAETQITLQVDEMGGTQWPRYIVISDDEQFDGQDSFHLIENGQVTLNTSNFGPNSYFTIAAAATPLSAPDIELTGDELNWEVVEHADKYEVTIELEDGTTRTVEVTGTALNLSQLEPSLEAGNYTVTVTAKTNNPAYADSEASNTKSYVVVIDKAKLKAKIDEINGKTETGELDKEEYTPESWQTLQNALEVAQSVFDDENATPEQVEEAHQDLVDAREGLTKKPGTGIDKSVLKNEYDRIKTENLTETEYTPGSWTALDNAMNEAERVLNDLTSTQAQVDKALQDLTDARTGLTRVIGTDASTLQTLVPSVGSLSPAFDPAKDTYTISVPNSVYQFQLTPTALDPLAKIEIAVGDGEWNEVTSGSVSENLALQVGGNKIVVRVTDSLGNVTAYKINVTRASSDNGNNGGGNNGGGGNTGGNSGSTPAPTPAPVPTPTPAPVKDNLETTRDGSHQPFATSKPSDNKETLVQVDPAKLNVAMSQGTGQQFAIHSPNDGHMKVDGLTLETLKQLVDQGSKLNISNPLAIYPVPGGKMDLNGVSGQLGNAALNDIDVHINIARSSDTLIDSAETRAASQGYELIVTPVDLDLTFTKDGQTVRSGQLNGYAPKYIALPEGIDPNRITTGVIINPDGSIFHVPTVVTKIDSRYYALINDLRSSGSYSVIWNPQDFEDAKSHWGKTDVNNIAARLDLQGNGDNTFSPNRQVTRSEFAEIVVLGLGLMRQDAPQNLFPDVNDSAWFRSAVALANEFGIVRGYDNGNFHGNQEITREQGFAMVARAYRLIEPEAAISPDQMNSELERYSDAADVSNWAKEDVAQLIAAGIIQGNGPEVLSPKTTMTRAEVTALIARMLKVTNLIDQ
ncbi:S-layer homology domain-containing protein [Paenibacillus polymyxa]|uniref:S-layer homology domain-containing protein n=1 Tax=Paenibacillus polymyxa TaxID=1406 RepID=UPI001BE70059|nr:S-layer homology domain-containing protein [Paenibacillus polymyxa]MBT2284924.1 S-layer homology domain-containing protein [Paenibacillus polymyxa]